MTADEYQSQAMTFANPELTENERLEEALMGLNGEAGECIEIYKKYKFQKHSIDYLHLREELGDVAWYLAAAANAARISLDDVFAANLNKLGKRYPDGFRSERSINRE